MVETVDAAGAVTPRSQAVLTSPTDAVVSQIFIHEGQHVHAGDELVQLSSQKALDTLAASQQALAKAPATAPPTGVNLEAFAQQLDASAEAAFASAKAAASQISDPDARKEAMEQIAQAEKNFAAASKRADTAVQQTEKGITDASGALAALGDAQHDQAQAAVAVAEANVSALTIKAPFDGTVTLGGPTQSSSGGGDLSSLESSLSAAGIDTSQLGLGGSSSTSTTTAVIEDGAQVGSGTSIATVVDSSTLGVTAQVDETDILSVRLGDLASVSLDAVPNATYPAKVIGIDQLPSSSSGGGGVSYDVRMSLMTGKDDAGHVAPTPRAGMSAVGEITVDTAEDAIAVPAAALLKDGALNYVWAIVKGRATRENVTLGVQGSDTTEVLSGLSDGQSIVVKGADKITQGQKLKAKKAS